MKKHKEVISGFTVNFHLNGAGYTVTVPKLHGLVTEGSSLSDARRMAKDAIRCHMEAASKRGDVSAPFR